MMVEEQGVKGRLPDGAGLLPAVEPVPVSPADAAAIPDADIEADEAFKLGERYRAIQAKQFCCERIVCTYPHNGNCWCFNTALAQHVAIAIEARRAETGTGSVHESAAIAQTPDLSTPSDNGEGE
jgi:hypothetical protein